MQTPFVISGLVERGQGAGKKMGAPTVNLAPRLAKQAQLPKGLYLGEVEAGGKILPALIYYGINSLTDTDCFETYLQNFSGDLYGQTVTVTAEQFLRGEKRFANQAELQAQIEQDIAAAGW